MRSNTTPIRVLWRLLLAGWVLVALTAVGHAQIEDDGSCVYDRRVYPEGSEMCQAGQQVRCEDGAWGDIGMCDDPEPGPPPRTGGGDVDMR